MANLITNGTFESGITGWSGSGGTVSQDSTQAHSGSNSLKCTRTGSQFGAFYTLSGLTPGAYYKATAWVLNSDIACTVRILLDWRDSGNAIITQPSGYNHIPQTGVWMPIYMTLRVPSNADHVNFTVYQSVSSSGDTMNIDDVDFEPLGNVDETTLVTNPTFATDTSFWTTNQNWNQSNAGATLSRITSDSADADAACAQVVTDGITQLEGIATAYTGLPALTTLTLTAMVKRISGSGTITAGVRDQTNLVNATVGTTSASWARLSVTLTSGISGNIVFLVGIYSTGTSATTFLVDAVTLGMKTSGTTKSAAFF